MKQIYGAIDIGGTNIRMAVYEDNIQIDVLKIPTPEEIDDAVSAFKKFFKKYNVVGIGIGMPGPADYKTGQFLDPNNLPKWHNKNLFDLIIEELGVIGLKADNDANLMALAYHHTFDKTNDDVTQFLTISTGVGAGLVLNGKIYQGISGKAMEVAKSPTSPNQSENYVGQGAVEYYSSGSGLTYRAKQIGINSIEELFNSDRKDAKEIINEGAEALGNFIATLIAIINPNTLVFDGSVAQYQPDYIKKAMEIANSKMYDHHSEAFEWVIGKLGDNAVLTGALKLIQGENNE